MTKQDEANHYRPPLDVKHLWAQVLGIQRFCNEKIQKREEDPAEEPKELE